MARARALFSESLNTPALPLLLWDRISSSTSDILIYVERFSASGRFPAKCMCTGGEGSQRGPEGCSKLQPEIVAVLSPPRPPPRRCRGGAGGTGEGHSLPGIQGLPSCPSPSPRCQGPEKQVRGRKHLVMWKAPRKMLSFQRKVTEIHSRRENRSCPT